MKFSKSIIIAALLGTLTVDQVQAVNLVKHHSHKSHNRHHHTVPNEYVMEEPDAETKASAKLAADAEKGAAVPTDAITINNNAAKKEADALKAQ